MKKTIILITTLLTLTHHAFATNGANLIGLTPASISMGGTGIAFNTGVESILKNPALLTDTTGTTMLYGANVASVLVKSRITYPGIGIDTGYLESQTKTFLIPAFGITNKINDNWSTGLGLFGTAGFGIDHRNQTQGNGSMSNMEAYLLALKLAPSIAYKQGPISLGLTPQVTYGLLSFGAFLPSPNQQRGSGASDSLTYGYQGGLSYALTPDTTLGTTYQSPIHLTFKRAFDFNSDGTYDDLKIDLPAEFGVGIATKLDKFRFTADVKQIYWSTAKTFKNLQWKDQTVYALGTQYQATDQLTLRIGYNYAKSPIRNKTNLSPSNGTYPFGSAQFLDSNLAFFNLVGLGGVIGEETITAGAAYTLTSKISLDLSLAYGLHKEITQSGTTYIPGVGETPATYSAKVDTFITTIALTWHLPD